MAPLPAPPGFDLLAPGSAEALVLFGTRVSGLELIDEGHLLARPGERPGQGGAEGAGADDHHLHD